jgi:hypothetical protein
MVEVLEEQENTAFSLKSLTKEVNPDPEGQNPHNITPY